jgi:signal transduction histidine kinase
MLSLIAGIIVAVMILILILIRMNSILDKKIKERTNELEESNNNLLIVNKKLEYSNEHLQIHDKMQKGFINVAAHELRTPIQPILGLSGVLQSKIKDKELYALIDIIGRNGRRLQRLTEDILDVTRIESHSLRLRKEEFNLNDVIINCINDITTNRNYDTKGKDDVKILYEPRDIFLKADKERLSQVISNLLSNAFKFTTNGTISIFSDKKDSQVEVMIKDTGTGIDQDLFPRLFTKFASKSFSGTGLGLFITKSIIEAHGGKIWAKNNTDGKGATFAFSLSTNGKVDFNTDKK